MRFSTRTQLQCRALFVIWGLTCAWCLQISGQDSRWSEDQANQWYRQQPWVVGANYLPSDADNELEMWQAATFNPTEIDRELGWAQGIGMNTMRVFLHNLLWEQDPAGLKQRIDQFLTIAAKHHQC